MHVCPLPSEKEDPRAAKKRKLQDEKNAEHKQDEESDSESDDSDSDSDSDSDYDVDNTLHSRPQTGKQRKSASEKAAKKDGFEVVPIGQPGENITPAIGPHLNGILAFSRSFYRSGKSAKYFVQPVGVSLLSVVEPKKCTRLHNFSPFH